MVKKRDNKLLELYKESFNFILESKRFFYFILGIFIMSIFLGYFILPPEQIYNQILSYLEELIALTQGKSLFRLISFIFFNNLESCFFGILFGIFFGIFPLVSTFVNGYFLGFVSNLTIQENGFLVLWRLLPHGIFELPAIFISLTLGLKLGFWLIAEPIKFYWNKNKLISLSFLFFYLPSLLLTLFYNRKFRKKMIFEFELFKENFYNSIKAFVLVILPLLIIAAVIEGVLIFYSAS